MAVLYQSVRMLAVYLMFVSAVFGILQDSPFKTYARLFAGLFFVLFLARCLSGLTKLDLDAVISKVQDAGSFEGELFEAGELGEDFLEDQIQAQAEEKLEGLCSECGYALKRLEIALTEDYQLKTIRMKVKELSEGDGNLERLRESTAAYFLLGQEEIIIN